MAQRISVGGEDFTALRKNGSYYVDKTELLYDLAGKTDNTVTLFTRPRRFGKTLTMSMIESFFSIFKKESTKAFDGLAVRTHAEFCKKYQNQYPVIFISFKDVEGLDFESALSMLGTVFSDLFIKYEDIGKETAVNPADAGFFRRVMFKEEKDLKNVLKTLMRMMNAVYKKPVILLIDEYDVPLAKAQANGYYREMLDVVRGIMSTSLKTNEYLKFAVVTGCLRIPKESIFTGVNLFSSYSVMDADFSQYFGFTHQEVRQMLENFGLEEKEETIREWYDGYLFGNTAVYCPWDVVNYVAALLRRKDARPRNYWENTSGNDAISAFFSMKNTNVSDKFEILLNGGTISENVTNALTYDNAFDTEDNLWSILLMTGYVTVKGSGKGCSPGEGWQQVELRIPNREVAGIFRAAVVDHFNKTVDRSRLQELMDALWSGDEDTASEILSDLLWNTISYMDYGEDYYHAFLAGIFVGRGPYSVQSNKERGLGRPDIDLRDRPNRRAIIIEAKISDSAERMEYWCNKAIGRISRNEYAKDLDGYRQVLCYGIAFYKKTALVRKMQ